MPRLFVAIAMPEDVAGALERLCNGLPDARWTDPDDFHLTLRFIGEVDPETFYEIGETLAGVMLPPFELQLKGLGQFPPRGPLRNLWVGVEPNEGLDRLRRRIERVVTAAGVPPDGRKFIPHVTIARFRQPPPEHRLARFLARRNLFKSEPFTVTRFQLFSSHLRYDGAQHLIEAEYDFVSGVMERA